MSELSEREIARLFDDIAEIKADLKTVTDGHTKEINDLKVELATVKTKLAVIASAAGLVGGGIVTLVTMLIKEIFK